MCRKKRVTRKFSFSDKYENELYQNLIQIQSKIQGIDKENDKILKRKVDNPPSGNYYTIDDPTFDELVEFSVSITQKFNYNCLFLQMFSLLEFFVIKICKHYDSINKLNYFKESHSYYIKDCKVFLGKELALDIGKTKEWEKILFYQDLRNLISHGLGIIEPKRHKKLLRKLKAKPDIVLLDNGNRAFIKNTNFLYEVYKVSFSFYQKLCVCIRNKTGEKRNLPDFTLK